MDVYQDIRLQFWFFGTIRRVIFDLSIILYTPEAAFNLTKSFTCTYLLVTRRDTQLNSYRKASQKPLHIPDVYLRRKIIDPENTRQISSYVPYIDIIHKVTPDRKRGRKKAK